MSWISSTVVGITTADAVYSSQVAYANGSRNSASSASEVSTAAEPTAAANPSRAAESAFSDGTGGSVVLTSYLQRACGRDARIMSRPCGDRDMIRAVFEQPPAT